MPARGIARDLKVIAVPRSRTQQPKYNIQPYLTAAIAVTDTSNKNITLKLNGSIGLYQANSKQNRQAIQLLSLR